ncbi:hypothetical protein RCL1_003687 [Eukaryota sp. TZLM3-RCL]
MSQLTNTLTFQAAPNFKVILSLTVAGFLNALLINGQFTSLCFFCSLVVVFLWLRPHRQYQIFDEKTRVSFESICHDCPRDSIFERLRSKLKKGPRLHCKNLKLWTPSPAVTVLFCLFNPLTFLVVTLQSSIIMKLSMAGLVFLFVALIVFKYTQTIKIKEQIHSGSYNVLNDFMVAEFFKLKENTETTTED